MSEAPKPKIPLARIMAAVTSRLGSPSKPDQHRETVYARHIACYLSVEAGWSLTQTGRWMNRHHSTALAGHRHIRNLMRVHPETSDIVVEIWKLAESTAPLPHAQRVFNASKPSIARMHPEDLVVLAKLIAESLRKRENVNA